MKLDYLQFLELEVFTRFGTRLEASMERAIQSGERLREILKQDRLDPLPAVFQFAWLIAFNEGLLDEYDPDDVSERLAALRSAVTQSGLTLDSPRDDWVSYLEAWVGRQPETAA